MDLIRVALGGGFGLSCALSQGVFLLWNVEYASGSSTSAVSYFNAVRSVNSLVEHACLSTILDNEALHRIATTTKGTGW